jgi:dTDP-4-amino-4,6-dideoxygalactose transaminase
VALGPAQCRESERAAAEVMSLPVHPELTDEQVGLVCAAIEKEKAFFFEKKKQKTFMPSG